ncbi:hypothetical protein CONPUDRAFT_75833 [Coniophora puteana RWD-64-598 SS2]|uniref:Uncharacterized protein n=1 Tax=Coniophora puteana (strain RWD-64-598) TaxID=741705 RepID=A0A5M3MCM1_CONPW|nr:uncharacterized protein CONPUDRAFT_75833 [Coniophora puteana RWD-64-598 SS2]EIW77002.1 hypothetical protein CONPUDRAFT_75833 [Coniophora puteana RWD-64-598 SS2]
MSSNTKANNTFSATNVFSGSHVEEWALSMLHYCRSEGCGIALKPRPVALATGSDEAKAERDKEIKEWDAKDMQARGKIGFKVDPHVWAKVEEAGNSTTTSVKTASEILAFLKAEYGVQKRGVTEAFVKMGKLLRTDGTVHFAQSADRYAPVDQREYFPAPRELPPPPPMQESVRDPHLLANQSGQRFQGTGAPNNFGIHQALDRARETASLHGSIRPLIEDVRTEVQREMLEERLREEPSMEIAETPQGSPTPTERPVQKPIAPEVSRQRLQARLGPKPLSRRLGSQQHPATTGTSTRADTGSSAEPDVNDLEFGSVADGLPYGTEFLTGPVSLESELPLSSSEPDVLRSTSQRRVERIRERREITSASTPGHAGTHLAERISGDTRGPALQPVAELPLQHLQGNVLRHAGRPRHAQLRPATQSRRNLTSPDRRRDTSQLPDDGPTNGHSAGARGTKRNLGGIAEETGGMDEGARRGSPKRRLAGAPGSGPTRPDVVPSRRNTPPRAATPRRSSPMAPGSSPRERSTTTTDGATREE